MRLCVNIFFFTLVFAALHVRMYELATLILFCTRDCIILYNCACFPAFIKKNWTCPMESNKRSRRLLINYFNAITLHEAIDINYCLQVIFFSHLEHRNMRKDIVHHKKMNTSKNLSRQLNLRANHLFCISTNLFPLLID